MKERASKDSPKSNIINNNEDNLNERNYKLDSYFYYTKGLLLPKLGIKVDENS
jgi:hypothetical protein